MWGLESGHYLLTRSDIYAVELHGPYPGTSIVWTTELPQSTSYGVTAHGHYAYVLASSEKKIFRYFLSSGLLFDVVPLTIPVTLSNSANLAAAGSYLYLLNLRAAYRLFANGTFDRSSFANSEDMTVSVFNGKHICVSPISSSWNCFQVLSTDLYAKPTNFCELQSCAPINDCHTAGVCSNNTCTNPRLPDYTSCAVQPNVTGFCLAGFCTKPTLFTQEREFLVTDLLPDTLYNLSVVAHTRVGYGPHSTPTYVKTPEAAPVGPPTQLKGIAVDFHTIELSWEPPEQSLANGKILGYKVAAASAAQPQDFSLLAAGSFRKLVSRPCVALNVR